MNIQRLMRKSREAVYSDHVSWNDADHELVSLTLTALLMLAKHVGQSLHGGESITLRAILRSLWQALDDEAFVAAIREVLKVLDAEDAP